MRETFRPGMRGRKRRLAALPAVMAFACPPSLAAADISGYLALTSDYVFRGVSFSDGHAAVQGGIDAAFDSGLYAGVWVSSVDIETPITERDSEAIAYLGFGAELGADWSFGLTAVRYAYPGARGPVNYDYAEYSASVNFRDRAWLEYSFSPDIFHTSIETHNIELYAEWPLPANTTLGAGAGWYDVSALAGEGYGYWQVGLSRPLARVILDLRLHDTSRAVPIISDTDRAKARIVLTLRYPFSIAGN